MCIKFSSVGRSVAFEPGGHHAAPLPSIVPRPVIVTPASLPHEAHRSAGPTGSSRSHCAPLSRLA